MRMLVLAATAMALATGGAAAADEGKPEAKKERKICREDPQTASRLGARKICKTAAEWKAEQDRTDNNLLGSASRPSSSPN